jgi:trehalose 6-phosphate synthase/phosphatase
MEEKKNCLVQFKFSRQTFPGEEIHITGNIPSLGNWSIENSERMITNNQDYPLWKSKENIIARQNSEIQYKYLIFKDGKFVQWEKTENNANRRVKVGNYFRLVINDPGSTIEKFTPSIPLSIPNTPSKDDYNFYDFEVDSKIMDSNININGDNINNKINLQDLVDNDNKKNILYENEGDEDLLPELNCEEESNDSIDENNCNNIDKDIIEDKEITIDDDLIICSLYLPVYVIKNNNKDDNNKWRIKFVTEPIYRNLYYVTKNEKNIKWVGILNKFYTFNKDELSEIYDLLEKKYKMFPLQITESIYKKLINILKESVDPIFHYMTTNKFCNTFISLDKQFELYRTFNEITTDKLLNIITEKSLILINDLCYFLIPSLLYSMCSNFKHKIVEKISIGYFIHRHFPSIDVFMQLPFREEILKSLLNCSVIGFHIFESNRNFLTAAKVLLNVDYSSTLQGDIVLSYLGRKLIVRVSNISPEPDLIKHVIEKEKFKKLYNELKEVNQDKFVFVSMDGIQFLITIIQKLEGLKRFIEDLGENKNKIIYYQYIYIDSEELDQNNNFILSKDEENLINQIKKFSEEICNQNKENNIIIKVGNYSYSQRLAILASANCFVRTSKRGSYSLGLYEFLLIKIFLNDTNLVEYMFSECINPTLANSIRIIPFDSKSIHEGFIKVYQNLCDKKNSKDNKKISKDNKKNDFNLVKRSSCKKWLFSIFKDIKNANNFQEYFISSGIGLNFKFMKNQNKITELNSKELIDNYELSSRRLIFFNLEDIDLNKTQKIISLLNELGKDSKNLIYIMSKNNETSLLNEFKDLNHLFLVSENGFSFKVPSENNFNKLYTDLISNIWITEVIEMLEPYTKNCEGASIEIQQSCIIWNYEECDAEQGLLYSKQIMNKLESSIKNIKLQINKGINHIKISNKNINKGVFASHIIKDMVMKEKNPDFIWAIGNSENDEILFSYLNKIQKELEEQLSNIYIYTTVIEKKPSKASNYIENFDKLYETITILDNRGNMQNSSKSSLNIKTLGL